MSRKVISVAASVLLATGALVLPSTAQAAQGDCGSGYACMWEHAGYQGGGVSFQRYIPDLSLWSFTNGNRADNAVSSVWNNGNYEDVCLFTGANGLGRSLRVGKKTWIDNLSSRGFNDQVSSAYFTGFRSC
ncbi:peptidase inhibitor family I36 protein [Actinomyces faecalis]|uniref:peptidase inhibitor family I36 protein n=1 Tax=Actinomyces faecalis TaxID=2722820 RepID=UPI003CC8331C